MQSTQIGPAGARDTAGGRRSAGAGRVSGLEPLGRSPAAPRGVGLAGSATSECLRRVAGVAPAGARHPGDGASNARQRRWRKAQGVSVKDEEWLCGGGLGREARFCSGGG
jgi:hypothetical protein